MQNDKRKISKKEFTEVIINNIDGKTNKELALEMGISDRHFYNLQDEYAIRTKDEVKKIEFTIPEGYKSSSFTANFNQFEVKLKGNLITILVPGNAFEILTK